MRGTIQTRGIVVTNRVFADVDAAEVLRPVGPFLLLIKDQQYGLATGNIINENWTWAWAGIRKDTKTPHGLLRDTDVDVTLLPPEMGWLNPKVAYVAPVPDNFIDLTEDDDAEDDVELDSPTYNPWKRGRKTATATKAS